MTGAAFYQGEASGGALDGAPVIGVKLDRPPALVLFVEDGHPGRPVDMHITSPAGYDLAFMIEALDQVRAALRRRQAAGSS